jgi:integration host factor subunit alpha
MSTLTKKDIIDDIATSIDLDRKEASGGLETFFAIIKEQLQTGKDVNLSGFGKWSVRQKHERVARNPKTGDPITIAPRRAITFSLSNVLRSKLED